MKYEGFDCNTTKDEGGRAYHKNEGEVGLIVVCGCAVVGNEDAVGGDVKAVEEHDEEDECEYFVGDGECKGHCEIVHFN